MDRPRVVAIVPAGGQGRRMGSECPKQYLLLGDKPVLWHTLQRFEVSCWIDQVVLVVRAEDREYCRRQVLAGAAFGKLRALVCGGSERWESVLAGLQCTDLADELVLVHDAVRPLVSETVIGRVVDAARQWGAAIAATPVKETVKMVRGGQILQTLERAALWSAQTPQGFRRELLVEAFARADGGPAITDEAMLVENIGHPVWVVEGDYRNLKITTPDDLAWAAWMLAQESEKTTVAKQLRVGQGYDVHRLAADRRLVLGGVEIPFDRGLLGHSDADVVTHAVIDALLGAVASGDIGRLFPDTDAQYKDISSLKLLSRVREALARQKAEVVNVDVVVMAQRPRLAPYIEAITESLADTLQVASESISVKATTTERLGFVGREEGIAAQAVVLVAR